MHAGAEIELFSIGERKISPTVRDVIVRGNAICWESPTTRRWINRNDTDCAVRQTKIIHFASMHRVDAKTVVKPCAFSAWRCRRRRRTKNNLKLGEKFHAFLMILENEFICAPNSSVISGKHWRFEWKFQPTFSCRLTETRCADNSRHALIRKHLFFTEN